MTNIGELRTEKSIDAAIAWIRKWLSNIGINGMDIDLRYDAKLNIAVIGFKYKGNKYEFTSKTQKNCRLNMWAIAKLMESKVRFQLQGIESFGDSMYKHRLQITGDVQENNNNESSSVKSYMILGLTPLASNQEIVVAYKKLIKIFHPDMAVSSEGRDEYTKRSVEINGAYDELKKERGIT